MTAALSTSSPPLLHKVSRKLRAVRARLQVASRKQLARAVYAMPALQPRDPRRRLVTFKSHCRTVSCFPADASAGPADWYLPLRPAETIRRLPAISVDAAQAAQFQAGAHRYQSGEQFEIPELFLASIERARLLRKGLITLSRDAHIFLESALSKPDVLEEHGILDTILRPRSTTLSGSHCLLGTPWAGGYYHWLIEALPRLEIIERFPALANAKLIVPDQLSRFQRDSLALAAVPENRLVRLTAPSTEVERLYFPQIPAPTGNPSPHAVAWLRNRFLPAIGKPAVTPTRNLYITRRDAPQRRLLNEHEIIPFLEKNGFEVASLSEMPFVEQVRLFSQARTVIAPHGAGVTNILFSPPGATLIELFGTNYINGCFWALANICGHRHAFLTGEPAGLDYRISQAQLQTLLSRLALS